MGARSNGISIGRAKKRAARGRLFIKLEKGPPVALSLRGARLSCHLPTEPVNFRYAGSNGLSANASPLLSLTLSRHRPTESRSARCSFPFHIGRQNHPAPLLHLVGDQFSKVVGRPGKSRAAQTGKVRLEFRNGDTDVDFPVQFFDDFCRRALWTANAVP